MPVYDSKEESNAYTTTYAVTATGNRYRVMTNKDSNGVASVSIIPTRGENFSLATTSSLTASEIEAKVQAFHAAVCACLESATYGIGNSM